MSTLGRLFGAGMAGIAMAGATVGSTPGAARTACEDLERLSLPGGVITRAQEVSATPPSGSWATPGSIGRARARRTVHPIPTCS